MPTDASGSHPAGVLTRPAPDWFDDFVGVGGFWIQGSLAVLHPHWLQVGLFNNATTGINLKVYGITVAAEGGSGAGLYFVNGTIGAFQTNCSPLRPDLPTPFGQIFQQNVVGASGQVNPFFSTPPTMLIGASGFDSATYFSPFPIATVPSGYSLVATNMIFSDDVGFYFWYHQAIE